MINNPILKKAIEKLLTSPLKIQGIYLFGSFNTEYQITESDLDLALLLDEKSDPLSIWQLAQAIALTINRDVDLIDLRAASTVFQYEIISSGTLVYCNDAKACDEFADLTYSMYLHFNDERKEIIDDIESSLLKGKS